MPSTNNIQLITKYATEVFDTVYQREAISSLLDTRKDFVRFVGAHTIMIAKISAGGLKNYTNANGVIEGYQRTPTNLVWETRELQWDRAATWTIEKFQDEESGGILIGNLATEVYRTKVVPEIDACAFSEIAKNTSETLGNYVEVQNANLTPVTAFEHLNNSILYMENNEVTAENTLFLVSNYFLNLLRSPQSPIVHYLTQKEYKEKVSFTVRNYEGHDIVNVPPRRFKTDIVLGDDIEGYSWGANSKDIQLLAVAKDAVSHIKKYELTKVLEGDIVLASFGIDGFAVFNRVYHGIVIPDNKKTALYCVTSATATADLSYKLIVEMDGQRVKNIALYPGDKFVTLYTVTTGALSVGDDYDNSGKALTVNTKITATCDAVAVDLSGKVIAVAPITIA